MQESIAQLVFDVQCNMVLAVVSGPLAVHVGTCCLHPAYDPLQIRGVPVGSVLSVQPSLQQVNVLVEIKEPTTVIPRNSLIEANQSGLIAESLIDITPQLPIPDYKVCTLRVLLFSDISAVLAGCSNDIAFPLT